MKQGYKWIARERESLDPYTDYERIWKLITCYYFNDFMMNFLYTSQFPNYIMTPQTSEAVSRGGTGKLLHEGDRREADTAMHFWKWFEHGPSSEVTKASVRRVNAIHQGIANKLPGRYEHNEDFSYTFCMLGAELHRLRLRVGLSGFTETEKIATHLYWQEMSKLFRRENDQPVTDFPDSWDGMLAYMEAHEALQWPYTADGAVSVEAVFRQFENRWFPKPLRFLGRKFILAVMDDTPLRVHHLQRPGPVTTRIMRFVLGALIFTQERLLPDPKLTTPEKHRLRDDRSPAGASAAV